LSTVSLVRCEDYGPDKVVEAVSKSIDLLGGIARFVKKGDRVLLKPNLLSAQPPEKRITTDPSIVRAVAMMVMDAGGIPVIGDSPALGSFSRVALKTGMMEIADQLDIEVVELNDPMPVPLPSSSIFKKLELASQAIKADVVINLPKLKTHSQMLFTLGVKNMFGTVVAQRKAEWHYMAGVDRDSFASLLIDIYLCIRPALTILDGIWGMEGHGPANGKARRINIIAAAEDAIALDVAVCHMLGIPLRSFPLYRAAHKREIGKTDVRQIIFKGLSPEVFSIPDFEIPSLDSMGVLPGIFDGFTKHYLVSKPVQTENSCIECGRCSEICPADAIIMEGRKIIFDYDKCIRCYCCQEICPQNSIQFHRGLLVKILNRFRR